jgi:hypothetical protein
MLLLLLLLLLLVIVSSALVLEEYFFSAMRGSLCLCLREEEEEEEKEDMETEKNNFSLSLSLSLSALCAYYIAQPEGRGMIVLIDRRWRFFVVRAKTNKNEKNAKKIIKSLINQKVQHARFTSTRRGARLKTTHISFVYIYDIDNLIRLQKEG